jgi:hypothetical protein
MGKAKVKISEHHSRREGFTSCLEPKPKEGLIALWLQSPRGSELVTQVEKRCRQATGGAGGQGGLCLSLHPSSPPFHLPLNLEATWCSGSSPGQYLILCEAHRDQKKVRWAQKPVPGPKSSSQQDMASAQDSRTQGCSPPGPAPPSGIAGPWDVCKRLSLQHTSCS